MSLGNRFSILEEKKKVSFVSHPVCPTLHGLESQMLEPETGNTYRKTNVIFFSCFQFWETSKENIQKHDYAKTKFCCRINCKNKIKFC